MKLTRMKVFLAGGMLTATGMAAGATLAAVPASAQASQVVLVSCAGTGQVRPSGYDIGCMANELLAQLHWTSWRSVAFGTGELKVNNCTPSCAQGKYIDYPVLTVLWRPSPAAPRRPVLLRRLTWIFTGPYPRGAAAAQTITLPSLQP